MFSDRFTGARNPARLPTTIQSRRIRCAPIAKSHQWVGPKHILAGAAQICLSYGALGGTTLFLVACSNPYASSNNLPSLHAIPVNATPKGCGFASKPGGNGGFGAFGTIPNGTITVGYPGFAAMAAPLAPGNNRASRCCA